MSSDGEDDDVEMLDSVNEDPTVGCAPACPAPVSRGKKNKLRSQVWEFFKLVKEGSVQGLICLTSDMWTSVTTTGYISLTAHYLDKDWLLQKKILNFFPLPPPHTGEHLSAKLFAIVEDWGIEDKLSNITLDNAANNGACAGIMKSRLVAKKILFNDVKFFHVRCCAHILALIVKEGLKKIDPVVLKIRASVKSLKKSQLVDSYYEDCPTDEEWEQIEVVTKFLKVSLKKESRNDIEFIRNMVKEMQVKFDSYWKELSPILAMTVVSDPRSKMNFVKFTYSKLYPEVRELERQVNKVRSNMTTLFNEYYTLSSSRASNSCATQNLGIQNGGNSTAQEGSDFFQEYVATQERGGDVLTDLSELDEYLGESYRGCLNSPLDILNYWKNHEQRFPVLSRMAGDILSIPISTVASESAFIIGGRENKIWTRTMGILKKMY
ncbi:zinc finger BED domain-containing protein DAYSLEEPER-like [Papaver somniferum]|uniref:zinc finger BED domain-containing protein DAYSLEEPER-like n=1 Tax=Papaver somniferum TaxID=3469 RepID=UPI000E6F55E2|nr:zinc finger BED domain-containing protein DAYSLEEPER-like [Papaver somniferum]